MLKKIFMFIVLFLLLTGCTKRDKVNIEIESNEVIIFKNIPLILDSEHDNLFDRGHCFDKKYHDIVLTENEEIDKLVANINKLQYVKKDASSAGICGFKYDVAEKLNDNSLVSVISIFEKNNKLYISFDGGLIGYRLISEIDFLEQMEFEVKD